VDACVRRSGNTPARDEAETRFTARERRRADVDAEHGAKPGVLADALMHHVLAHAASPRIVRLRTHVEILIAELAPHAEHLDALRLVAVDQEVVRHNDFKYSTRRAAARHYNRDPAFL